MKKSLIRNTVQVTSPRRRMDESRRLQNISHGLYTKVNGIVGPERLIQIRRTVTNLKNDYEALYSTLMDRRISQHLSGSFAEGFRFRSSDVDVMYVYRDVIVTDRRHTYNHSNDMTVLCMETEQCRPGFALLRLVPPSRNVLVTKSCVRLQNRVYVSSSQWKQTNPKIIPSGEIHGPCDSGILGDQEVDLAYCFRCVTWPDSALGFISRLRRVGWLHEAVLRNILKEGCHMVAIGSKGCPFELTEWRISFSFAEKTLIHNMNQYQFLCYGLLKIFLKEVLENRETGEKLLCSYFLKNAVFWEICDDRTIWSTSTFLHCFWACFGRLISWVYNGYCPNFFIPENNMFYRKIQGQAQSDLLGHLMTLYNEGYSCLLRCPSLQPDLDTVIQNQQLAPNITLRFPSDTELYSQSYYNIYKIEEMLDTKPNLRNFSTLRGVHYGLQTLSLLSDHSDELQRLVLKTWQRFVTQYITVTTLFSVEANKTYSGNKEMYTYINYVLEHLGNQSFDLIYHYLLTAVHLYRRGFYHIVVKVLLQAKRKLQRPDVMYSWTLSEDQYRAAGGDQTPMTTMMKKVVAVTLSLTKHFFVPELTMEHQTDFMGETIIFPPSVMIKFLSYLCHYNLQQYSEAKAILEELTVIVTYDEGYHIYRTEKAISWTMLGICQEMSGELNNAYHSYSKSLLDPSNDFFVVTIVRIVIVMMKIYNAQKKPYR